MFSAAISALILILSVSAVELTPKPSELYPKHPKLTTNFGASFDAHTSLRAAALKRGILMGAARNYYHDASDSEYVKVLAAEYDLNTPENACKWSETEPRRGGFNFSQCSAVDSFAVAANSSFRGHNL